MRRRGLSWRRAPGRTGGAARGRGAGPMARVPELRERLENGRHFVWIKRKVTPDVKRRVEALGVPGVGFARESRRYYPKRSLAAHLLGSCGMDNQGLAGLEYAFDGAVRGTP